MLQFLDRSERMPASSKPNAYDFSRKDHARRPRECLQFLHRKSHSKCCGEAQRLPDVVAEVCYRFTRGSPTAMKYLVRRLDQAHSQKRSPASQLHRYMEPSTPPTEGSSVWHAMPIGV